MDMAISSISCSRLSSFHQISCIHKSSSKWCFYIQLFTRGHIQKSSKTLECNAKKAVIGIIPNFHFRRTHRMDLCSRPFKVEHLALWLCSLQGFKIRTRVQQIWIHVWFSITNSRSRILTGRKCMRVAHTLDLSLLSRQEAGIARVLWQFEEIASLNLWCHSWWKMRCVQVNRDEVIEIVKNSGNVASRSLGEHCSFQNLSQQARWMYNEVDFIWQYHSVLCPPGQKAVHKNRIFCLFLFSFFFLIFMLAAPPGSHCGVVQHCVRGGHSLRDVMKL